MVSGIYGQKVIIIIRNVGFRLNAGKVASRLFGDLGAAGGHKTAARVEIPVATFKSEVGDLTKISNYIQNKIRER
jgi:nanoRNase/pAp phosphatase (c-di-AMP/oligoRNAs hydrolase)